MQVASFQILLLSGVKAVTMRVSFDGTQRTGDLERIGIAEALEQSLIFSRLDQTELNELASLTIEYSFATGNFIFLEGDEPQWFYLVREGRVRILKQSPSGKEFTVAFFGSGEMFGEVAVFEGKPYPASAQAMTETRVLGIRRADFLSFLTNRPVVALKIINVLGGRLREAHERLRDLAAGKAEQRLAKIMLMLSSKIGSTLPFTRQEIADMAGTTTETTIRVMSRLKKDGIIRSGRGKVVILDETKLRLLGEGPPQI
jgi:CRP/FNR family transcriptional regulator